jgi:hypothetical protein
VVGTAVQPIEQVLPDGRLLAQQEGARTQRGTVP